MTTRHQHFILLSSLVLCVALRAWVWYASNATLEDAFITFRYVENIAAGEGFVFNKGERVLGTTTPLWTLLLSAANVLGSNDAIVTSKTIGIILDAATLALMFPVLSRINFILCAIFTALFVSSPSIATIAVSGMETPMVLFTMALAFAGLMHRNVLFSIGLAALILTRIDGVIFASIIAGFALSKDRTWTLKQIMIVIAACLPWFVFSQLYFGSLLPQSALAKTAVYDFDAITTMQPLLSQFTPFNETHLLKFSAKCLLSLVLLLGMVLSIRKWKPLFLFSLFLLLYCCALAFSGVMIFRWYLVPAIFASYVLFAIGAAWLFEMMLQNSSRKQDALAILFACILLIGNASLLQKGIHALQTLQEFEESVRKRIGLWLQSNVEPGSTVFLEPLGYIGYYAGNDIVVRDEIGIVTPEVLQYRTTGDGWYVPALQGLKPGYVIQYAYALRKNASEGTGQKLFGTSDDRRWFDENFQEVITFDAMNAYPSLEEKEKKYIVFRKR